MAKCDLENAFENRTRGLRTNACSGTAKSAEHAATERHELEEKQAAPDEELDRTDNKNAPVTRDSPHATVRSILTSQGQPNSWNLSKGSSVIADGYVRGGHGGISGGLRKIRQSAAGDHRHKMRKIV